MSGSVTSKLPKWQTPQPGEVWRQVVYQHNNPYPYVLILGRVQRDSPEYPLTYDGGAIYTVFDFGDRDDSQPGVRMYNSVYLTERVWDGNVPPT